MFADLEFKTLGKRILGDEFNVFQTAPVVIQTDLFGQPVADRSKPKTERKDETIDSVVTGAATGDTGFGADKTIKTRSILTILYKQQKKSMS